MEAKVILLQYRMLSVSRNEPYNVCIFLNPYLYGAALMCRFFSSRLPQIYWNGPQNIFIIRCDLLMDLVFMQQLNGLDSLAAPNYVINIITIITISLRYCQSYEYYYVPVLGFVPIHFEWMWSQIFKHKRHIWNINMNAQARHVPIRKLGQI